jgi:CBS domain containing-hemolysin-like protein
MATAENKHLAISIGQFKILKGALSIQEQEMTSAMTKWSDVSLKLRMDSVLDCDCMNEIRSNGKSRIPILHETNENIVVGVMISKSLLNLDVNENKTIKEYYLAGQIRIAPVVFRNMSEKLTDAVSEFEQF